MAETCRCDVGMSNTGVGCSPKSDTIKKLVLVPYFDSTGAKNRIDLTATLDSTFFSNLVNQADTSKRWFPTPELKKVDDNREDNVADGDTGEFVTEGSRKFTAMISGRDASPALLARLKDARCLDMGVYLIDRLGNIEGMLIDAGFLAPYRINSDTWSAKWVPGTKERQPKIMISFDFHEDERDENIRMILTNEMNNYNLNQLKGLIDVESTYSSITTTSFKAKLTTPFGTPINPIVVKGLLAGDFALYNNNTSSSVTIVSATESPNGTYMFTFAIQTSGHKLKLTPTKTGYDFAAVVANLITIP